MKKRIFDIVLFFIVFAFSFPIILIGYVFACCDTFSNGIFTQKRVGQNGQLFTIFKLKTIHPKTRKISRIGKFLRDTKIDEIPQLYNIFKGDMSFVGPRPDIEGYYDLLEGENRKILELKPGITSRAGLKYANEERVLKTKTNPVEYNDTIIFPDKVRMNLDYYYKKSLVLDVKIIYLTVINRLYSAINFKELSSYD